MKVRIISHTPICPVPWWYRNHVGEEFEVSEHRQQTELYKTTGLAPKNIMRCDCEMVQ